MSPEKENTFRALREQGLLVTSVWCRFGIHTWTRWKVQSKAEKLDYTSKLGGYVYHRIYVFEKTCSHCNEIVRKREKLFEERQEV